MTGSIIIVTVLIMIVGSMVLVGKWMDDDE